MPPDRSPARRSRWAATALTATVTAGVVGVMADAASVDEVTDVDASIDGAPLGAIARHRGEVAAAELMAAADPGETPTSTVQPPRIGRANVS